jgi:hypothetical protein
VFSNVSISLASFENPHVVKKASEIDTSKAIVKGDSYSHSFTLHAPQTSGRYLVYLGFHAVFSPEGIGLPYYDFNASSDYNNTSAGGGNGYIAPTDLPPINVAVKDNQANSKGRLIVEVEEPYGVIRPIPVTIGNVTIPVHTCKNGSHETQLVKLTSNNKNQVASWLECSLLVFNCCKSMVMSVRLIVIIYLKRCGF